MSFSQRVRFLAQSVRAVGLSPTLRGVLRLKPKGVRYPITLRAWQSSDAQFMARRKAGPLTGGRFDLLPLNSREFMVAFRHLARRLPAAAMRDALPALSSSRGTSPNRGSSRARPAALGVVVWA